MLIELQKLSLQLLLLGVVGGGVTWCYSRLQKRREMRVTLLRDFADLHGQFVALRFRYNASHVIWAPAPAQTTHPLTTEEVRRERWHCFSEACSLIGKFQAQKPLLTACFQGIEDRLNSVHQCYQEWRRRTIRDKPILQETEGKNEAAYEALKQDYQWLIARMKPQL